MRAERAVARSRWRPEVGRSRAPAVAPDRGARVGARSRVRAVPAAARNRVLPGVVRRTSCRGRVGPAGARSRDRGVLGAARSLDWAVPAGGRSRRGRVVPGEARSRVLRAEVRRRAAREVARSRAQGRHPGAVGERLLRSCRTAAEAGGRPDRGRRPVSAPAPGAAPARHRRWAGDCRGSSPGAAGPSPGAARILSWVAVRRRNREVARGCQREGAAVERTRERRRRAREARRRWAADGRAVAGRVPVGRQTREVVAQLRPAPGRRRWWSGPHVACRGQPGSPW